jgi:hypothetical protein
MQVYRKKISLNNLTMDKEKFAYSFDPEKSEFYDEIMLALKKYNEGNLPLMEIEKYSNFDIQEAKNYSYNKMIKKYNLKVDLDNY